MESVENILEEEKNNPAIFFVAAKSQLPLK